MAGKNAAVKPVPNDSAKPRRSARARAKAKPDQIDAGTALTPQQLKAEINKAFRVAMMRPGKDGRRALARIAETLVEKAEAGDMAAARELLDRTLGKSVQAVEHSGEVSHAHEHSHRIALAVESADARIVELTGIAGDQIESLPAPSDERPVLAANNRPRSH